MKSDAQATFQLLRDGQMISPERETIYFIRKSTPHLYDVTMSGPFYPRFNIVEQIKGCLHKISLFGLSAITEIGEDEAKLSRLISLSAPLDACLTNVVKFEIIAEHNPHLAAHLPCPVYNVSTAAPLVPRNMAAFNAERDPGQYPLVSQMDIHGSYLTLNEAKAKAEELSKAFEQQLLKPESFQHPIDRARGTFSRGIRSKNGNGEEQVLCVEVRYDSGQIRST